MYCLEECPGKADEGKFYKLKRRALAEPNDSQQDGSAWLWLCSSAAMSGDFGSLRLTDKTSYPIDSTVLKAL